MSLNGYAIETLEKAAKTGVLTLEDGTELKLNVGEILSVVKWLAQNSKGGTKPKLEKPEDFQAKVTCK